MATIPSGLSGGSGLDINGMVSQLMQIEQRPLQILKQKEVDYQAKISAYATLLTSVSGLKSAFTALKNTTVGMSASSSDSTFFTATASSTAVAGTSSIIINNTATAQSIYSTRFGSQTGSVADLSVSGTQKIKIQVGSNTASEITINSTNNTLSGIASAITGANAGVTASVIKESSNFVIDATNNTIVFNDGTANRTATITAGNYTGAALATAIQSALNTAPGSTNTFAVDYSTTSLNKFTIKNTAGPAVNILWASSTATPQQFGFAPGTSNPAIGAGAALTGTDTVDGTYKLTLTSNSTGTANRITLKVDETGAGVYNETGANIDKYGLSVIAFNATYNATTGATTGGITNLTQSQVGLDAKLKVNGIEIFRASNTITDAITGVTLTLLKGDATNYALASPVSQTLTVSLDSSSLSGKLTSLVSSYNSTMRALNDLKGNQNQRGILSGDSTVTTLKDLLIKLTRTMYGASATSVNNYLPYIGLTHDKNGVLQFDSTKLSSAYTGSSANDITNMVNNMSSTMESAMNNYVTSMIPARQSGYQTSLKDVQKSEDRIASTLTLKETALRNKFIALDRLLTQLNNTSNYLTQQMSSLSSIFGGKK